MTLTMVGVSGKARSSRVLAYCEIESKDDKP